MLLNILLIISSFFFGVVISYMSILSSPQNIPVSIIMARMFYSGIIFSIILSLFYLIFNYFFTESTNSIKNNLNYFFSSLKNKLSTSIFSSTSYISNTLSRKTNDITNKPPRPQYQNNTKKDTSISELSVLYRNPISATPHIKDDKLIVQGVPLPNDPKLMAEVAKDIIKRDEDNIDN